MIFGGDNGRRTIATIKPEDLSKFIKEKISAKKTKATKTWAKQGSKLVDLMMNEMLDSGISPVAGKPNFKGYSRSSKKKGKKNPVDLYESGRLRNSLKVKPTPSGDIGASYGDPDKILEYHQDGTDKMRARPLIPKSNQKFKKKITDALRALYVKIYKI